MKKEFPRKNYKETKIKKKDFFFFQIDIYLLFNGLYLKFFPIMQLNNEDYFIHGNESNEFCTNFEYIKYMPYEKAIKTVRILSIEDGVPIFEFIESSLQTDCNSYFNSLSNNIIFSFVCFVFFY